jgi:D-tyrosyl-tRNA(Tyr) deacylase
MIALIQRVSKANVAVEDQTIAEINTGILLLLGVEKGDTETNTKALLEKVLNFRIFEDAGHKMNLSLLNIQGDLLVVPQFTLAANTQKGTRPSFASAAPPDLAEKHFQYFVKQASRQIQNLQTGCFGADMQVNLTNSGPVTFWLKK